MKRFLLMITALFTMMGLVVAQQITSVKMYITLNGEKMVQEIPASGFSEVDLTDEATTEFVINSIEVMTSGSINNVSVIGSVYKTTDQESDKFFLPIPLQPQGNGKWALYDIDKPLSEGGEQESVSCFEFYAQANDGAILYNNNGANYKIFFTNGENDNWTAKYFKEETATLALQSDVKTLNYTFSGDMERSNSEMPGSVSSLAIVGFWTRFVVNQEKNITPDNVSLQYKVYPEGQGETAGWNRLNASYVKDEHVYNQEKKRTDHRYEYAFKGSQSLTEGLVPNKNYVLQVMYQIVDNTDSYTMLGKDYPDSFFYFSVNTDGIVNFVKGNAANETYDLSGRRMVSLKKGITIRNGKKVVK